MITGYRIYFEKTEFTWLYFKVKNDVCCQEWWYTPIIPALKRLDRGY
jgi:hypothetical protein